MINCRKVFLRFAPIHLDNEWRNSKKNDTSKRNLKRQIFEFAVHT